MTHEGQPSPEHQLTEAQEAALSALCGRYHVEYRAEHYSPRFDLPPGYVAGWVGGYEIQEVKPTLYAGCSPEGEIST